jgi:hypothetical protein
MVFKGAYQSLKNLVMVLRNLMESLLRRLQDVIDGQATILSTSQKLYTQLALFRAKVYK